MQAILCEDITNAPKGALEFRTIPGELLPCGIAYRCPHCGEEDWLPFGTKGWAWNGVTANPSLTPSIKHTPCGYHAYLVDGEWLKQPDSP